MRRSVFFVLLATAAMPALAAVQSEDLGDRRANRAVRSERGDRGASDKAQRPERVSRGQRSEAPQIIVAVERTERSAGAETVKGSPTVVQSSDRPSSNDNAGRRSRAAARPDGKVAPVPVVTRDSSEGVTNWRSRERRAGRTTSPTIPATPTTSPTSNTAGSGGSGTNWGVRTVDSGTSTTTTRSGSRGKHHGRHWSGDWRRDDRYNWRHHRSRYSSIFRLGRYYDPFGYGYQRFSIGSSMWPSYYGNNYWLNDPWDYRLPPTYGPYRWIRYYDDALLVDIYDGQVVDVIRNFFW